VEILGAGTEIGNLTLRFKGGQAAITSVDEDTVPSATIETLLEKLMLKQFRVQNYKALKDVTLELTPIHVLIGPNDSGKTSILEAIAALSRSTEKPLETSFSGSWQGRMLVWHQDPTADIKLGATFEDGITYELSCRFGAKDRVALAYSEVITFQGREYSLRPVPKNRNISFVARSISPGQRADAAVTRVVRAVFDHLHGLHFCRWNSKLLSLPVAPDAGRRFRMDESGFGLALCLDDILGYDREAFTRLEDRFKQIFPQVQSIKLIAESAYRWAENTNQVPSLREADGKGIYFQLVGNERLVAAAQMSDGVMLVLAYLTLLYLPEAPRLILIEEPENGIHPKRLKDVLNILRAIIGEQDRSQVVLTTHSPYVVDSFLPDEVSMCKKDDSGAVSVHRLSASKTVLEQLDVFSLGEIWTAEGDEAISGSGSMEEVAQ
jgi:predicted ATPase